MQSGKYETAEEINALFKKLGVKLLNRSRFSDRPGFQTGKDPGNSVYFKDNEREFRLLNDTYGKDIAAGKTACLYIMKINRKIGYGLFAGGKIPEGALIGEYSGVVSVAKEAKPVRNGKGHYSSDYSWDYPPLYDGCPPLEINAAKEGNPLRFVNHSFHPNCAVDHTVVGGKWVLFFKTLTDVAKDTQLTVDYGEAYWSGGFRTLYLF